MTFIPPPPSRDQIGSRAWQDWFERLRAAFTTAGTVTWDAVNKSGSDLADLQTRRHNDLQTIQGGTSGEYYHLRETDYNLFDHTGNLILPKTSGYGIKVDTAAPTYGWKDLLGSVIPKTTGVGSPTLTAFRGGNVRAYSFAAGEDYDGAFHIPHDWAPGTDLYWHVHWLHNGTAISGNLVLNWYFTYAKGHNQANYPAEINVTQTISTPDIATVPQYRHRIDEFQLSAASPSASQLDTDDIEVDGIIQFHMDATTIPTITGGTPNKPFIFYIDLHYQSTNMPTKQKAPNFYS
jgi:hypothetical protein